MPGWHGRDATTGSRARPGSRSARRCPTAGRAPARRRAGWSSTPACAAATRSVDAGLVVAPAVRDAHDAGHDRRRSPRPARSIAPARERTRAGSPSARPRRAASSGCTCTRAALLALHEHGEVVHPRVVRAQVRGGRSSTSVAVGRLGRARRAGARRRRRSARAPARSCPLGVRSTSGRRGSSGPRSMPCGFASSVVERQAVGVGAEAVAVRAGAQHAGRAAARGRARGAERGRAARRRRGPASGEPARRDLALDQRRATTKSSSASMSASGPWPAAIAGEPQQRSPTRRLRRRVERRAPAASSSRRCAPRAGRARRRSASARSGEGAGRITSAWRVVSLR